MKAGIQSENGFAEDVGDEKIQMQETCFKEMFEVMVQNANVSMYVLEGENFTYVNDHFCQLVGYPREELILGRITIEQLVHLDDLSIVQESVNRRIDNREKNARYRVRLIKKDGCTIHVEVHGTKTMMGGKAVIFGTVLDVTEGVQATLKLKENQERFKSLFDNNNPDAVFTFDMEGNFTDANLGCGELSGYTIEELLEISFFPLIVPSDLVTAIHYFGEAIQGNTNRYEISITRKDGIQRDLEVTCFPMQFGEKQKAHMVSPKISQIEMRTDN